MWPDRKPPPIIQSAICWITLRNASPRALATALALLKQKTLLAAGVCRVSGARYIIGRRVLRPTGATARTIVSVAA